VRRRGVLVGLAVVLVAGAAVLFVLHGGSGSGSARSHALRACADATTFENAVKRNADIDTVNRALNRARAQAHTAEQKNSLYTGLASGLEALRVAIDHNDADAARVGIDVVRSECGYVHRG
jgi:uncharacterized protein (UPF0333 family)